MLLLKVKQGNGAAKKKYEIFFAETSKAEKATSLLASVPTEALASIIF